MNQKGNIEIIEWDEKYKAYFVAISIEWLEKYASVEPEDLKILNNPEAYILDKGGTIFFAKYNNTIIGTVALIKDSDAIYELAKLGVKEEYKGLKIGQKLMQACIDLASKNKAEKIILYTNKKLTPALGLYEKFGFKEIALENNKYIESDLKMELIL